MNLLLQKRIESMVKQKKTIDYLGKKVISIPKHGILFHLEFYYSALSTHFYHDCSHISSFGRAETDNNL